MRGVAPGVERLRGAILLLLLQSGVPIVVLTSATSHAEQPAAFSGSTSLLGEWHGDNRNDRPGDDDFGDAVMRTNLALDGGDTRFALRLDGEAFLRAPAMVTRRNDLRIERVSLDLDRTFAPGGHEIRTRIALGDFYAQLGHGLALSLRRVDELGLDVALRGARADVSLLQDRLTLTALGGVTNPVNIEAQELRSLDDPHDPLGGARIEGRLGSAALAAFGVAAQEGQPEAGQEARRYAVGGATVDVSLGDAVVAVEVDAQERRVLGAIGRGHAIYGTTTVPVGRATFLVEGKHYARFQPLLGSKLSFGEGRFLYSFAPTAERIDQELLDNTDISGGRLRSDVAVSEDGTRSVHASLGLFRDRAFDLWFAHGFGGIDWRWPSGATLLASGGYRREWDAVDGALFRAIAHGEIDAIVPLGARLSLHAIAKHESHAEPLGDETHVFHRGGTSVELDFAARLALAGGVDWDTQSRAQGVANVFGFGLVRYRASDAFIVQITGGTQRGGIRCIAGACRLQPSFAGARVEVTARF